jgi:hypothetical protein
VVWEELLLSDELWGLEEDKELGCEELDKLELREVLLLREELLKLQLSEVDAGLLELVSDVEIG